MEKNVLISDFANAYLFDGTIPNFDIFESKSK